MTTSDSRSINLKAARALKKAVLNAIKDHARTGDSIVVWRRGKVARVSAKKFLIREKRAHYGK
ncbi:MAG: hypothetical protein PHV97_06615 [Candidatus Omnitrophica bacterium]|nr:hypothetical protein [Candidatus Omnitrophota bacterium]